jgi:hypothetical protein
METMRLTDQQSLRIAELPEDYRVVGVDGSTPLVRKPTGQLLRIQQNDRLIAATRAARRRLAGRTPRQGGPPRRRAGDDPVYKHLGVGVGGQ